MPFTTSHPALVIPLKKLWPNYFSLSGLIAGAMSPDLLYFLQLRTENRGFSHSWDGLFIFCLPAGIVFCFVFHRLFKRELIRHLPGFLEQRLRWLADLPWQPASLREWLVLVSSVLVGALSHFFWDSWTHGTGETVRAFPWLLNEIIIYRWSFPICELLHHGSSMVGGLAVLSLLLGGNRNSGVPVGQAITSTKMKLLFQCAGVVVAVGLSILAVWLNGGYFGSQLFDFYGRSFLVKTTGLATWAGYFYFVCGCTIFRRCFGSGSSGGSVSR